MKRIAISISTGALSVLAFFLLYVIISQSLQNPPGSGPSLITDMALLVTVILVVAFSFWMVFGNKGSQRWWKQVVLVIGLICSSVVFWLLSFLPVGLEGIKQSSPSTFDNIALAGKFMLIIALMLGVAAILALILIVDLHETKQR